MPDSTIGNLTLEPTPLGSHFIELEEPVGPVSRKAALSSLTSAVGVGTAGTLASDTDGTLSANSDTRIATQKAIVTYIAARLVGGLKYKGTTDCSGNPNYPAASQGDMYLVSVAGKIGGGSGTAVDVGDWYIADADNAGGTEGAVGASWGHLEHNLINALVSGGPLGTPSSGTLTNCTGLPGSGLVNTAVTPGTYTISTITVDQQGRLTAASSGYTVSGTGTVLAATASPTFTGTVTGVAATFSGNMTLSGMTAGSVIYAGTSGLLSQDNSNFFWDATNHRLAVGLTNPNVSFVVSGDASTGVIGIGARDNGTKGGFLYVVPTGLSIQGVLVRGDPFLSSAGTNLVFGVGASPDLVIQSNHAIKINKGSVAVASGAVVDIDSLAASSVGLIVRGAASATADLFQSRKSDDTVYASIGPTGYPKWAGSTYLASDVTNATGTLANVKKIADCISGVNYFGYIEIPVNVGANASEGFEIDFNGGSATFSAVDFGFVGTPIGATVGTAYSNAIATPITVTTATTNDIVYRIFFSGTCNGSGTLIVRGAVLARVISTVTFRAGAASKIEVAN